MKLPKPKSPKPKRSPGRPALPLPDTIPDTPENVAQAILSTPPKATENWQFLKKPKPA
ncbi:MAG: hypothetical protein OXF47_10785 [Nitrospira sp.]|nr:hypothetical protein [Nitrospira sp.]